MVTFGILWTRKAIPNKHFGQKSPVRSLSLIDPKEHKLLCGNEIQMDGGMNGPSLPTLQHPPPIFNTDGADTYISIILSLFKCSWNN